MSLQVSAQLLRPRSAARKLDVSRATFYRFSKLPDFPAAVKIGPRAVGWLSHELDAWIESRRAQGGAH